MLVRSRDRPSGVLRSASGPLHFPGIRARKTCVLAPARMGRITYGGPSGRSLPGQRAS
jgi:hypothetical protein